MNMSSSSPLRPNLLLCVSAPALALLTVAPPHLQPSVDRLLAKLPPTLTKATLITGLTYAIATGIGLQLNSCLEAWARSNWLIWRGRGEAVGQNGWDKEVAIVTGGSSGIGNLTVKGLAEKGIKVCVLDLNDLPEPGVTHDSDIEFDRILTRQLRMLHTSNAT